MIGEIKSLHPVFRIAIDNILKDMRAKGWDPVIGSGMRSNEQQDALFAQGRQPLEEVNRLRIRVGLPPIKASQNTRVTNARGGQSNHNHTEWLLAYSRDQVSLAEGFAVDIVDRRRGWDIPNAHFWTDLGALAKQHGCAWGGDWSKPDPAHVEMKVIDAAPMRSVVV